MSSLNKNNVLSDALNWDGELLADIQNALKEKLREMDTNANGGVSSIGLSVNSSNQLVVEITRADGTKRAASYDVSNMIGGGGSVVMGRIVDGMFYPATRIEGGNAYADTPLANPDTGKLYIDMPHGDIYRYNPNLSDPWDRMSKIAVDGTLSSTSNNPISNKAVTIALEDKLEEADIAGKADKLAGMLHPGQWPKVVVRNITIGYVDDLQSGDVFFDNGLFYLQTDSGNTPIGAPKEGTLYYCLADNKTYYWRGNSWNQAGGSGNGTVQSVTINGVNHEPINGVVDLGNVQGEPGPKGDTGNVQVDGNGNVLIVNSLTEGGTGAALSAEMGKRLAMLSGTFAAAWAHSKAVPTTFCWLWQESVDGSQVCKPIWHVGNSAFIDAAGAVVGVDAAAVPQAPAFTINGVTPTNNSEVNKNTELVITPDTDSVLCYKIGSGSYVASDKVVTIVLDTAGETYAFEAYCTNNKGDSTHATLTLSVAGTALATIEAKTGSTMTGTSPNFTVNRGGYVTLKADGDLTYTTDGSDPTSSGTAATVNGPNASVDIQVTGSMTIKAFNTDENDDDSTVSTWSLSIEALAKPSFSQADNYKFPAGGGQLAITAPTGYGTVKVYYNMTTDGTTPADPTNASTEYTGAITINADTKIKAIAYDGITASPSAVESASYTIAVAMIKVKVNAATTMNLGDTGLTEIPLTTDNNGVNEFTINDINTLAGTSYTSFADHVFPSISFGDKLQIVNFDGGGVRICNMSRAFSDGDEVSKLVSCEGIVLAINGSTNPDASYAFSHGQANSKSLEKVSISGVYSGSLREFAKTIMSSRTMEIDLAGLVGTIDDAQQMFMGCSVLSSIDLSGLSTSASGINTSSMFRGCTSLQTIKFKKLISNLNSYMFFSVPDGTVKTLVCVEPTPYTTNWISLIGSGLENIFVPDEAVNDYKEATEWSTYASIIKGISQYTD